MSRIVLPLEPGDKASLERFSRESDIPLGVLVFLRKQGYCPVPIDLARQHGIVPGGRAEARRAPRGESGARPAAAAETGRPGS